MGSTTQQGRTEIKEQKEDIELEQEMPKWTREKQEAKKKQSIPILASIPRKMVRQLARASIFLY